MLDAMTDCLLLALEGHQIDAEYGTTESTAGKERKDRRVLEVESSRRQKVTTTESF